MRHLHTALIVGISSVTAVSDADALSFGRVRSAVILGQNLNVAVPLVLAPGEDEITDECVRAEVMDGDTAVPANLVRARITRGSDDSTRVVRVSTTMAVEEPVVTVTVLAGCPTRLSRSFTLLGDPPTALARTSPPITTTVPAAPVPPPTEVSPAFTAAATASPAPRPAARREPPVRRRPVAVEPRQAPEAPPTASLPRADAQPGRAEAGARARQTAPERPRLQLESGSVSTTTGASVAIPDPAASAAIASAQAAEAAASAVQGRVKELEAEVERLRAISKEQADSITQLRVKAAQGAQPGERSQWLPWVAGLAALSMALAAWLAYRVRQLAAESRRHAWWMRENQSSLLQSRVTEGREEAPSDVSRPPAIRVPAPPPIKAPETTPSRNFAPSTVNIAPETIPAPAAGVAQVAITRQPARASSMQSDMQVDTHRAVTVDEQIDLEQQADFFIALGHDDAAIDLLLAHLRSTGGAAPISYLKLLEMYHRRGDRDDYEVMRRRFNQRFNSVAPDWDSYGQAGRPLIEYPTQVARLQAVWPNPLDAMAELEAMAFGRGSEQELFDLPAYQDVLFLYQLARQLHEDSGQGKGAGVDVLLPLGGETAPAPLMTPLHTSPTVDSTIMGSLDLDVSTNQGALLPAAVKAIQEVDLDLPSRKKPRL
jgi:hypothetical protein